MLNSLNFMVKARITKSELEPQKLLKACFGTSEWSENSGICCQCKLKDDCGKMNSKRLGE